MKKILLIVFTTMIIAGVGSFYGGIKYSESKNPRNNFAGGNTQNFRNLSPEERQQML